MSSAPKMVGQRLTTKLYLQPARQTLVERPVLLDHLKEGLRGKLTLVSAPAGFGKTSLVAAWQKECETPLAWVSLDEEDNEPLRFLDYLIGALQMVDTDLGDESAELLRRSSTPPIKVVLTSLLNEINAYDKEFVVAFDDYHVIHEHGIHEALSYLIERLAPHAHALIATRSDPPFPLGRLRARGELKELRASDLRFDNAEAAAFLNEVMNLELTPQDVAALEDRTEGWIAGLQLSALSLQGRPNRSELVKDFAGDNRFVLDYLLEEVLHCQTEEVQDFLLRTSVLTRLNGSLCDALTGDLRGHEMLEQLDRANLFLIRLDNRGEWFRYHHLFADLLRLKLKQKQPGAIHQFQITASEWCGVQVEWEVFDWGRKKREVADKAKSVDQANNALLDVQSEVLMEVNARFRQMQESRQLLKVAKLSQTQARANVQMVTYKYRLDAVLLKDVLQAQTVLANSDYDYQKALLAFWTAKADFEKAIGEDK